MPESKKVFIQGEKMSQRKVGKILKPHGLRGEVFFYSFSGDYSYLDDAETLYLQIPRTGELKPFQLEKSRPANDGEILTLKGVTDRNQSEAISKSEVFVDESLFESEEGDDLYLVELENFQVFNGGKKIGYIVGFSDNGMQDLFEVELDSKEIVLIPFVEEFVEEILHDQKEIYMQLPQGLLEINQTSEDSSKDEGDDNG